MVIKKKVKQDYFDKISITNNEESYKQISEKAQTANFSDLKGNVRCFKLNTTKNTKFGEIKTQITQNFEKE